jgi:hypothetical protein
LLIASITCLGQTPHRTWVQLRLSRVTQQRVTFCANFLILSEPLVSVNQIPSNSLFFLRESQEENLKQGSKNHPSFVRSRSAKISKHQFVRQANAEHSAPEFQFNCSGLGLDSGLPFTPGNQPRSNTWTALRLPWLTAPNTSEPSIMPRCEAVFHVLAKNTAIHGSMQLASQILCV